MYYAIHRVHIHVHTCMCTSCIICCKCTTDWYDQSRNVQYYVHVQCFLTQNILDGGNHYLKAKSCILVFLHKWIPLRKIHIPNVILDVVVHPV